MTPATFETFRPRHPLVARFVDYYYIDRKPENVDAGFTCFPHHNTTLSISFSHRMPRLGEVHYVPGAAPLQVYTPVRTRELYVRQVGPVDRVVIVFHLLGIQRFWRGVDLTHLHSDYAFFTSGEMEAVLRAREAEEYVPLLDGFLLGRYRERQEGLTERVVAYVRDNLDAFSVSRMATDFRCSRRHLSRVFRSHTGITIKKYHEILLLRRVIDHKLFHYPRASLTDLAYTAAFSDQSHMIRTFRRLTRTAPGQFFRRGKRIGQADTFWHLANG